MAADISVHRGLGGAFLDLQNENCPVFVQLPNQGTSSLPSEVDDFSEKAKLTLPCLQREIVNAKPSDFSWRMSHRELRWHKWLLSTRPHFVSFVRSVECLSTSQLDGNLSMTPSTHVFQWSTVDSSWEGYIFFNKTAADDADWIRHLCSTFRINGDPNMLRDLDDAAIRELIVIREPVR